MSTYRVLIAGDNLLLNFDGQPRKLGFYVSRIVEAQNHGEAETPVRRSRSLHKLSSCAGYAVTPWYVVTTDNGLLATDRS